MNTLDWQQTIINNKYDLVRALLKEKCIIGTEQDFEEKSYLFDLLIKLLN